jgi:hypothetical protein
MAKAVVDTLDQVPEALRSEYEPRDGKFYLKLEGDVPGFVPANKHAEFRNNNIALMAAKTELETKLKSFEGIDPTEYASLKAKIADLEKAGVKKGDDVLAQVRAAAEAAVKPVAEKLALIERSEADAKARLAAESLRNALTQAGMRAGVAEKALTDYISRGQAIFQMDQTGAIVARKNSAPVYNSQGAELTIDDWVADLTSEAPHLFNPSRGGGANPSPGGVAGRRVISTDPLEFGRNLEDIAKGKAIAQ